MGSQQHVGRGCIKHIFLNLGSVTKASESELKGFRNLAEGLGVKETFRSDQCYLKSAHLCSLIAHRCFLGSVAIEMTHSAVPG